MLILYLEVPPPVQMPHRSTHTPADFGSVYT